MNDAINTTAPSPMVRLALLVVACALASALYFFMGLSLGLSLLIVFVGWPLVGTLVTLGDDLPGGWSNPEGDIRPEWLQTPFWGQISAGLALSAAGRAIDLGWMSQPGGRYWVLAAAAAFLAAALVTRRWWLLLGFGVVLGALWF